MTIQEWEDLGVSQDERYLVDAIRSKLLTQDERREMFNRDISIEDVLNGRTTGNHDDFVQQLFNAWNKKLGWTEFGY